MLIIRCQLIDATVSKGSISLALLFRWHLIMVVDLILDLMLFFSFLGPHFFIIFAKETVYRRGWLCLWSYGCELVWIATAVNRLFSIFFIFFSLLTLIQTIWPEMPSGFMLFLFFPFWFHMAFLVYSVSYSYFYSLVCFQGCFGLFFWTDLASLFGSQQYE